MAELDIPGRPAVMTVYLSPGCPELRTRVRLEFVGFPRRLWSERNAGKCVVTFGGVTYFDAAEHRQSGRMVVEARVTRVAAVPKRVTVMEGVRVPGGMGFLTHNVRLDVLSAEPVHEERGDGEKDKHGGSSSRFYNDDAGEVDTEERPESVNCYL